ncbi:MAG: hypothetical protein IPK13_19480 [Deltaproteobacteria bacterium]|nr:hypothetical protein [Deltaproteobacteria bacterium]
MRNENTRWFRNALAQTAAALTALTLATGCGGSDSSISDDQDLFLAEATAYLSANADEAGLDADDISDAITGVDASGDDDIAEEASQDPPDPAVADTGLACHFPTYRARVMAHYDEDGDGAISDAERANIREDFGELRADRPRIRRLGVRVRLRAWHAVRWAFDEDGDHKLNDAERAVLVATFQARCEARRAHILETYDANGNGQLDADEITAFRIAQRERLKAKRDAILEAYDADGNGILDVEERSVWKADIAAALRTRRAALFAEFDADQDGALNASELAALKTAIQEAIASGQPVPPRLS